MTVKKLENQNRPREKAIRYGIDTLTNQELLATILQSGTKDHSVLELAKTVLCVCGGIERLHCLTYHQLMSIRGIKQSKAVAIMSTIELAKRMQFNTVENLVQIHDANSVYEYIFPKLKFEQREKFYVLFLNTQNEIIHERILFIGSLNISLVHPREIFKEALSYNCASIICVHNHPSGSLEPSSSDIEVTKKLDELGKMMQITLLDHMIVSYKGFVSLKSKGYF